jgi:hypothetical protein
MTTIYVRADTNLPARKRHEHYPTERSLIKAALTRYAIEPAGGFILGQGVNARYIPRPGGYVLDPGAGDGRWGQAAKALYPDAEVQGVELRNVEKPDGIDAWIRQKNFITFYTAVRYGLICGNPPYGPKVPEERKGGKRVSVPLAEHFIRRGFDLLAPGGRMLYLLPLQLMAGKDRYNNLWRTHPPTLVAVVSPRPSFGLNRHGRRGTNGTDYALFVWDKALDGDQRECVRSPVGTPRCWLTEPFIYQPQCEL